MAQGRKAGKPSVKGKKYSLADKRAYWSGYALGVNGYDVTSKEFNRILDETPEKCVSSLVNGSLRGTDKRLGR